MKRANVLMLVTVLLAGTLSFADDEKAGKTGQAKVAARGRHVDLAICLDTSGSMRGLIGSAKEKLWAVVNELATAKPKPLLRVALYQYGNNSLNREVGWVQKICDLTDDLDTVYGKLFPLTTNGGTEYVSRVVRAATEELKWNAEKSTLRIIFVAGNEPATQDKKYKLRDICAAAAGKGIIINTIFCGRDEEGQRTGWADAARWADGRYASIDQDRGTVVIKTPYDKKLTALSAKLNSTYVPYGRAGRRGLANQAEQDANARKLSAPAAAQRAAAKAGGLYHNAGWDLVDAIKAKKVELEKVEKEALPEKMQKMTPEQRKEYVAKQGKERTRIQKEIGELNAKREAYVKAEMGKQGLSEGKAFDAVLRAAIRIQAEQKGFVFQPKERPAK